MADAPVHPAELDGERRIQLHAALEKAWHECHANVSKKRAQQQAQDYWRLFVNKEGRNYGAIEHKIEDLRAGRRAMLAKSLTIDKMFDRLRMDAANSSSAAQPNVSAPAASLIASSSAALVAASSSEPPPVSVSSADPNGQPVDSDEEAASDVDGEVAQSSSSSRSKRKCGRPASRQASLMKQIADLELEKCTLNHDPALPIALCEQRKQARSLVNEKIAAATNTLRQLKRNVHYKLKSREAKKRALPSPPKEVPVGRPRLEIAQPGLRAAIIGLVEVDGAADPKRRSEALYAVRTLDDLLVELRKLGYTLSRTGLYNRLIPRNPTTREGRRHKEALAIRLMRAENSARKRHPDSRFAAAGFRFATELTGIIGKDLCFVISQDDKAKCDIGTTLAKVQKSLLMSLRYKV